VAKEEGEGGGAKKGPKMKTPRSPNTGEAMLQVGY
jgi:hypothetical protein